MTLIKSTEFNFAGGFAAYKSFEHVQIATFDAGSHEGQSPRFNQLTVGSDMIGNR
jgi:hypothetical protein